MLEFGSRADSVLQRFAWDGQPREVAVWWTLRRGNGPQRAICRMFTHAFGHELRLEVKGQLVESQVCRTDGQRRPLASRAMAGGARGEGVDEIRWPTVAATVRNATPWR
jgi:hypothetical protein